MIRHYMNADVTLIVIEIDKLLDVKTMNLKTKDENGNNYIHLLFKKLSKKVSDYTEQNLIDKNKINLYKIIMKLIQLEPSLGMDENAEGLIPKYTLGYQDTYSLLNGCMKLNNPACLPCIQDLFQFTSNEVLEAYIRSRNIGDIQIDKYLDANKMDLKVKDWEGNNYLHLLIQKLERITNKECLQNGIIKLAQLEPSLLSEKNDLGQIPMDLVTDEIVKNQLSNIKLI
jgi:hypothetical protein